ncbi:MAG: NPCBM/NEW2 domain-containing protein [Phycisphaerae bacterium]|nr:NPCBM/NEW2 domain-containing protein [Phycisphaerae bacterium]
MFALSTIYCAVLSLGLAAQAANETSAGGKSPTTEYLSELPGRFLLTLQAWGELGINTCAHAPGQAGEPMKIGQKTYVKGLGHHASGEMVIDLSGEYERFEAEVGVQPLPGAGSVVFQVLADDKQLFDSGIMRSGGEAKLVSVPVGGAHELQLIVTDAGDGISCDCANWGEARLIRAAHPTAVTPRPLLDVAPFARVVTCDPKRTDGSRANRIQEYHAEDIYLESPLKPDAQGSYTVPADGTYAGCIGLKWLEERRVRRLVVEFAKNAAPLSLDEVQLQCWTGESAWQGNWKPLDAKVQQNDNSWIIEPDWSSCPEARGATRKLRGLFPTSPTPIIIKSLTALAPTPTEEVTLLCQLENAQSGQQGRIELYNGQILGSGGANAIRADWNLKEPLRLKVRYAKSRRWKPDRTVVRFELPEMAFGVAVQDVLENDCVYVRDAGLFVTTDPAKVTLPDYLKKVTGQETMLERVRKLPDQTLAQAMARVHHPQQDVLPTMLSLACDNHKCVVYRNGMIRFSSDPRTDDQMLSKCLELGCELRPVFGSGKNEGLSRQLDEGWYPIPVTRVREEGILYQQRTFVVPVGDRATGNESLFAPRPSVCVAEFTLANESQAEATASLVLTVTADITKRMPADLRTTSASVLAQSGDRLLATLTAEEPGGLKFETRRGATRLTGKLPPNGAAKLVVVIPLLRAAREQIPPVVDTAAAIAQTKAYWRQMLASSMQIETPDALLNNIIRASQVHCMLAARNEEAGRRVAPWIASVHYGPLESESHSIIRGMGVFGHQEFAERSFDYFIQRFSKEGFLTTGYTLMGTGWHLWTLGEFYGLTRNEKWLSRIAPEIGRVCKWILAQRAKTSHLDALGEKPPEYGLMPPGVMADWNAFAFHFCLNGYYCAGLREAGQALVDVGYPDADKFVQQAGRFTEDIFRAYRWTQARTPVYPLQNGTWVPGYPSQVHSAGPLNDFFPGQDGNRSWCYDIEVGAHHLVPFGMLDPKSRDVTWMMDHMEDVQFLADGWFDYAAVDNAKDPFNFGGFAKVQPYYCRNAEINALRDDVKPFIRSYFNALASLVSAEDLALQEHFHGAAAWNKTHETGYLLHQSRLMMVMERGDELWLAPFVTDQWLKDGMTVGVKNAPTRFGPVSYRIESSVKSGVIKAELDPATRTPPKAAVLRLRHPEGKPIRQVAVEGQDASGFETGKDTVRILKPDRKLIVRVEY